MNRRRSTTGGDDDIRLGKLGQFAPEQFYENVLGLTKLFRLDDLVFFDCGGVRLMLEGTENPVVSPDICHYFSVTDIDEAVAALKARNVNFSQQPHLIADMPDHELWMAFFSDPDNHTLALMEERWK